MRRGTFGAVLVVAAMMLAACAPTPPPPRTNVAGGPSQRHPVVIIHGWQFFCSSEDDTTWASWIAEAHRRGYAQGAIGVFSYDTCRPSAETIDGFGRHVDDLLRRNHASKVNVIAHSMGSLIARECIRFGSCAGKIDKFFSVAGANHGTIWANFCALAFWSQSTCDMKPDGPFLAGLNADDETWGDVEYVTMTSWCDLTIVPFTSTALEGALNIVDQRCLSHTDWRTDPVGTNWALDWFDGRPPQPTT